MQLAPGLGAAIESAAEFTRVASSHAPLMDEFRSPSSRLLGAPTRELIPTKRADRIARVLDDPKPPNYMSSRHPDMRWQKLPGARLFGASGLPRMEDVTQGFLGDCWFVVHMGAMAHTDPVALSEMFEETKNHYIVHFADESVAVSKRLPIMGGHTAFAGGSFQLDRPQTGIWAAVLEKAAAAREAEGYASLKGGQARWGFRLSLGAVPRMVSYSGSTPAEDALRGIRLGLPTAVGTMPGKTTGDPTQYMTIGQRDLLARKKIHGNHYYVVVGAGQAKDGANTIRLWEPLTYDNGSNGYRDLTWDEFNTVITDTDTTERYGDYSATAQAYRAELHERQPGLSQTPWISHMDQVTGFLS